MIHFFISLLLRSATVFLSLVLTYLQASTITIAELGFYNIGYVVLLALSTVSRHGLGLNLIKICSGLQATEKRENIFHYFTQGLINTSVFSIATGLVSAIVFTYPGTQSLLNNPPPNAFYIFLASILPNSFLVIFGSYLRVINQPNLAAFFESAGTLFLVILFAFASTIFGISLSLTHYAFFYSAGSYLVFLIAILYFLRHSRDIGYVFFSASYADHRKSSHLYKNILDYVLIEAVSFTTYYGIYFVASFALTPEKTGVFVILYRISSIFNFILVAINSVTIAELSRLNSLKLKKELNDLCNKSLGFAMMVSTPLLLTIALFHEAALALFNVSADNTPATYALLILLIGQYSAIFSGSAASLLSVSDLQKNFRSIVTFCLFLTLALSTFLSHYFGVVGVACGITISLLFKSARIYLLVKDAFGFYITPIIKNGHPRV